jgi:hypothetical protein
MAEASLELLQAMVQRALDGITRIERRIGLIEA